MYRARVALRWSDMDALGHINNSEYLTDLEQARIEFLADAAAAGVPREAGLLVARHEVDYRKPMPYRRKPIEIPTGRPDLAARRSPSRRWWPTR